MVGMALSGEYVPSPWAQARDQVTLFEATGGREGNTIEGRPIIVLTTVGAKTCALRKTPLMRVEHDGAYAVLASIGGAPKNPFWYHNIVANPRVELQDGATKHEYLARLVTGDERAAWWERACETWPPYPDYAARAATFGRQIPVFVLERTTRS
jgi:deazaflavin-dependent oxidoreductase (nitroreductase family)